ncbi:CDK-activating kinase assembly factor [Ascodesmis nigricans]|uniref:RNA polymerase II transcription factor B subunit 3 n=1 Tax=Ascodesmis nigricans TaxID=341454 RepID=A0A4S2N7Q5_9PEZI|nr:CDK-activating kinase assembly factor [Ascodesmis nigricans]
MPVLPRSADVNDTDEYCPVCKSSRYLNPNIRFLIEPSCYHKMCGSCVDRLFSGGPANCPVAGCHARLRHNRFRTQTFTDIAVEREVDARRRISKIFNKRAEEFKTPREWDDYLESIEDITFSLIQGTKEEKAAAEKKLNDYEEENRDEIRKNAQRAAAERKAIQAKEKAIQDATRLAREHAQKELKEELEEQEERKRRQLQAMESGDLKAVEDVKKEFQARAERRKREAASEAARMRAMKIGQEMALQALIDAPKLEEDEVEEVWEPLGKGVSDKSEFYELGLPWPGNDWVDNYVSRPEVSAGGYSKDEYYERCLFEAFAGLTVIVGQSDTSAKTDEVGRTDVRIVDPS